MSEVFSIFLGCVIYSITNILFVRIVSKLKVQKSKFVLLSIILIMSIIHTIMVLKIVGIIKTIITLFMYIISYKLLFGMNWKKTIFLSIIHAILILIPDLGILVIATSILGISKDYYYNVFAGSFLATIMVSIGLLLITYIFRNFLNKILNIRLDKNIKIIIISGLVLLCVGFVFFQFVDIYIFNDNIIIYILTIIFFIIVLFNLIKERVNNDSLKEQYDKLLEFMVTYEKEVEEQRILRHENKNNLIAIKSKIIEKDNEKEIVNYIDELLNISTKIKNEKYA